MADVEIKITGADANEINQLLQLAGLPTKKVFTQNQTIQKPQLPRFGFINSLPIGNVENNQLPVSNGTEYVDMPAQNGYVYDDDSAFDLDETAEHDCGEEKVKAVVGTGEVSPVRKPPLRITNNFGDNPMTESDSDECDDDEKDAGSVKKNVLIDHLAKEFGKWLSEQGIAPEEDSEEESYIEYIRSGEDEHENMYDDPGNRRDTGIDWIDYEKDDSDDFFNK